MSAVNTYWCDRKGCEAHSRIREEFVFVRLQHTLDGDDLTFCSGYCLRVWAEDKYARLVVRGGQ